MLLKRYQKNQMVKRMKYYWYGCGPDCCSYEWTGTDPVCGYKAAVIWIWGCLLHSWFV